MAFGQLPLGATIAMSSLQYNWCVLDVYVIQSVSAHGNQLQILKPEETVLNKMLTPAVTDCLMTACGGRRRSC